MFMNIIITNQDVHKGITYKIKNHIESDVAKESRIIKSCIQKM